MTATDARDGWEVLTKLTKRTVQFAYMVFLRRTQEQATTTADIAQHFKDCTDDLAASALHEAADAGALKLDEDGQWHVTDEGLCGMRVYYKEWSEHFDADDEAKGLS